MQGRSPGSGLQGRHRHQPDVPEELQEHLTVTADGLWVVWAHKLAWQRGDLFVPLRRDSGYPADARADVVPNAMAKRAPVGNHPATTFMTDPRGQRSCRLSVGTERRRA